MLTFKFSLAHEVWERCAKHNEFKLGMRRIAYYARSSWLGLDVMEDDLFDATDGFNERHFKAFEEYVEHRAKRQKGLKRALLLSDLLFVLGRRSSPDFTQDQWADHTKKFGDTTRLLLTDLNTVPASRKVENHANNKQEANPRKGDFAVEAAAVALKDFGSLFPIEETPWFVIAGTFLGLIRENGFLTHDYDVDVGVSVDDPNEFVALINERIASTSDFEILKEDWQTPVRRDSKGKYHCEHLPVLFKLVHRDGVHIDVFFHYSDRETGNWWHGSFVHRWVNEPFELAHYQLAGQPVLGPADADAYLVENYGDWRTPVTHFHTSTGSKNLRLGPNLSSIALFLKRLTIAVYKQRPERDRVVEILNDAGILDQTEGGKLNLVSDNIIGGS